MITKREIQSLVYRSLYTDKMCVIKVDNFDTNRNESLARLSLFRRRKQHSIEHIEHRRFDWLISNDKIT